MVSFLQRLSFAAAFRAIGAAMAPVFSLHPGQSLPLFHTRHQAPKRVSRRPARSKHTVAQNRRAAAKARARRRAKKLGQM